jgi:predicted outer membrane repeat protein
MAEIKEEKMKSSKLWMGIPLIILVFTVVLGVVLTSCDPDMNTQELIGKWEKDGSNGDYTVEFTGTQLKITDNTGSTEKPQTRYYSIDGNKIIVKLNTSDTIPKGELTYSFPSEGKLSITGTYESVQGTIAGTYTRIGGSSGGPSQPSDPEEPTPNTTVTSSADSGTNTLRAVIASATAGDIIAIGSGVTTIELQSTLIIDKNLTIQGKGVTLKRNTNWTSDNGSAIQVGLSTGTAANITVNISRVCFNGFQESGSLGYGAAIYNRTGSLKVESCIFANNTATTMGGAIATSSNAGSSSVTTVKGCTFYNNSTSATTGSTGAVLGGGAIGVNAGTLNLTGNLFYGNAAPSYKVVVVGNTITLNSGGYNVSEIEKGTGGSQSGFDNTNDKTLADLNINANPINVTTYAPKNELKSVMPSTAIADFPLSYFDGTARTWPGAPGAVK